MSTGGFSERKGDQTRVTLEPDAQEKTIVLLASDRICFQMLDHD